MKVYISLNRLYFCTGAFVVDGKDIVSLEEYSWKMSKLVRERAFDMRRGLAQSQYSEKVSGMDE